MKIKAAVFDLFGTLVHDKFSAKTYPGFLAKLARILGLEEKAFTGLWQDSYLDRCVGKHSTLQDNIRWIGEKLSQSLEPDAVEEAAKEIVGLTRLSLIPRDHALDTLMQTRRMGLKTALISDCGPAVPIVWHETVFAEQFDATAFSCREGLKKPDPRFYRLVVDRLNLRAEDCFYLGDGNSGELEGAKAIGFKPALIWSAIDRAEPDRLNVRDWAGTTLLSLKEVPGLLEKLWMEGNI